jgi:hypothetical protein
MANTTSAILIFLERVLCAADRCITLPAQFCYGLKFAHGECDRAAKQFPASDNSQQARKVQFGLDSSDFDQIPCYVRDYRVFGLIDRVRERDSETDNLSREAELRSRNRTEHRRFVRWVRLRSSFPTNTRNSSQSVPVQLGQQLHSPKSPKMGIQYQEPTQMESNTFLFSNLLKQRPKLSPYLTPT